MGGEMNSPRPRTCSLVTTFQICTRSGKDVGAYVTIGVQVGKDPDNGARNLSIHRMLLLGKDRLSLWAPPDHHLGRMILKAEEKKRGLEVATAIGVGLSLEHHKREYLARQEETRRRVERFERVGFDGSHVRFNAIDN